MEWFFWSSSGALEHSKCTLRTIKWDFDKGYPMLRGGKTDIPPTLQSNNRTTKNIRELLPYESHKILGHHKAPCSSQYCQFHTLKEKEKAHALFLSQHYLSSWEARTYCYRMYLSSITYYLEISYFSPSELHSIELPTLTTILSKCHINNKLNAELYMVPLLLVV